MQCSVILPIILVLLEIKKIWLSMDTAAVTLSYIYNLYGQIRQRFFDRQAIGIYSYLFIHIFLTYMARLDSTFSIGKQ